MIQLIDLQRPWTNLVMNATILSTILNKHSTLHYSKVSGVARQWKIIDVENRRGSASTRLGTSNYRGFPFILKLRVLIHYRQEQQNINIMSK